MNFVSKTIASPVGELKLFANLQSLAAIVWENDDPNSVQLGLSTEDKDHPILLETQRQLAQYFEGKRWFFSIPIEPVGTEFQKKVWKSLCSIPFGETRSYGQLAQELGNKNASRAVGGANRKNPISIIVPCHRVIGTSGHLTGFAGGLNVKAHLLKLEKNASQGRML